MYLYICSNEFPFVLKHSSLYLCIEAQFSRPSLLGLQIVRRLVIPSAEINVPTYLRLHIVWQQLCCGYNGTTYVFSPNVVSPNVVSPNVVSPNDFFA
jgi:hypothetical protein